jgi:hypothetical protein
MQPLMLSFTQLLSADRTPSTVAVTEMLSSGGHVLGSDASEWCPMRRRAGRVLRGVVLRKV